VRPKTIVFFEWIVFGTILLDILQTYLDWDQIIAQVAMSHPNSSAVALTLTVTVFVLVLVATLTLLVARRRSKIAMWVSIALFAFGLFSVFVQSTTDKLLGSDIILAALENIGQVVAYGLLFTPLGATLDETRGRKGQAA
jgi:uncharacterized protein YhhL (DUF1145 family)